MNPLLKKNGGFVEQDNYKYTQMTLPFGKEPRKKMLNEDDIKDALNIHLSGYEYDLEMDDLMQELFGDKL